MTTPQPTNLFDRTRLTTVLARTEWPDPTFDADTVSRWPAGDADRLVRLGLLAETGPAGAVVCDGCARDHVERVVPVAVPGRPVRAFVRCPAVGLVEVPADRLRRWAVTLPRLARATAAAVGAAGDPVERVPGRVWTLGPVRAAGRAWPAVLAVGLTRPDAAAVVARVPELKTESPVVFVPAAVPPPAVWAGAPPPVVALTDLLAVGPAGLVADRLVLDSALIPVGRPLGPMTAGFPTPPGVTWEQVSIVVEDHHLVVTVGGVSRRVGFAAAGFEERRTGGVPNRAWRVLALLARFGGVLGTGDRVVTKPGELRQQVSVLRRRLRELVGIAADPFAPVGKGREYRARFAVWAVGLGLPAPVGWADVAVTEVEPGVIEVAVSVGGRVYRSRPSPADLGLVGADGAALPAGAALVAVLRAGGRVVRPARDPGLLALGAVLGRVVGVDAPAFEFLPAGRVWVARFTAGSVVPAPEP